MAAMTSVLHVTRGFSAQPTLRDALPPGTQVLERPLAEALVCLDRPDVVWVSSATADAVHAVHTRFPQAALLATVRPAAPPEEVVLLIAHGADLVLRDGGVLLGAAAVGALARRRAPMAGTR
jgi:hypothetical protein